MRMADIIAGKFKKCPNSFANMSKIAAEFGRHNLVLNEIIIELDLFSQEDK